MGWLRDLMQAAEPPLNSYGQLARTCLARGGWPAGIQPKARSLAALFSKFDRGIELEWLQDRPQVQSTLAEVLGSPLGVIKEALTRELGRTDVTLRRWRLPDAPQARPLDLREEPLPPGLAPSACHPIHWGRVWWRVAVGADAALVRRKLQAREEARTLVARNWGDLSVQLGEMHHMPLFVELLSTAGETPAQLADFHRVCIACRDAAPGPGWRTVTNPPLADAMEDLMQWLEERLPQDGQFDPAEATHYLNHEASADTLDSVEAAIGLGALLDELGIEAVRGRPLGALLRTFVERRLESAGRQGTGEAQWLKRHGFDALLGMAKRAFTESSFPWESPREEDEWMALVPLEFQQSVDAEWAQRSLANAGSGLTVAALERAIAQVPPGSFRVVRALSAAQLLGRTDEGQFRLAPRWLCRALGEEALEALVADPPGAWGEALLRGGSVEKLSALLFSKLLEGDSSFIDAVLEIEDPEDAALACAVETAVEIAGLGLLAGAELGEDQVAGLLEMQAQLTFEATTQCEPRLGAAPGRVLSWRVATWALSEHVPELTRLPSLMAPWGHRELPLLATFDALAPLFERADAAPWFPAAHALFHRLALGHADSVLLAHSICLPSMAVDNPEPVLLSALAKQRHGVSSLRRLLEAEGREWKLWCGDAWRAWSRANFEACLFFAPDAEHASDVWSAAPSDTVTELVWLRSGAALQVRFEALSHGAWCAYLEATPHVPLTAWETVPASALGNALEAAVRLDDVTGLRTLWRRYNAPLLELCWEHIEAERVSHAAPLLNSAPASSSLGLLGKLPEKVSSLRLDSRMLSTIRHWLHGRATQRSPHWREGYKLLATIETRLRRAQRARG